MPWYPGLGGWKLESRGARTPYFWSHLPHFALLPLLPYFFSSSSNSENRPKKPKNYILIKDYHISQQISRGHFISLLIHSQSAKKSNQRIRTSLIKKRWFDCYITVANIIPQILSEMQNSDSSEFTGYILHYCFLQYAMHGKHYRRTYLPQCRQSGLGPIDHNYYFTKFWPKRMD